MSNRTLVAAGWTGLILLATLFPKGLLPASEDESRSGGISIPHLDKAIHATLFFGFGGAWIWAGSRRDRRRLGRVLVVGLILAAATELGQAIPIVERDPDLLDGLADAVGLLAGIAVGWRSLDAPPPD